MKYVPKNSSVFIAKDRYGKIFQCQFAPLEDGLGWYGFLKLPERNEIQLSELAGWKKL